MRVQAVDFAYRRRSAATWGLVDARGSARDPTHDPHHRGFASDNYAGAHPEILVALTDANGGHQVSHGEDDDTARLQHVMKEHFGPDTETFPVFNGTGANVTALTSLLPRWGPVIGARTAHVHTDENGLLNGSAGSSSSLSTPLTGSSPPT